MKLKPCKYQILTLIAIVISPVSSPALGHPHPPLKNCKTVSSSDSKVQPARFHHVRLNVTDPKASIDYYKKFFSAVPVRFRGVSDALLTDRSYLLLNTVKKTAPKNVTTALWHIGWGGIDGHAEHKWRTDQGIKWGTDITTVATAGGDLYFMYAEGPDHELAEIWTGTPYQRYNHVHLLTKDVNATRDWYIDHLGAKGEKTDIPKPDLPPAGMKFSNPKVFDYVWNTQVDVDGVIFNIFGLPDKPVFWWPSGPIAKFEKTEGHVIDHFAFSYPKIEPVFTRMKADGVEIVKEITWNEKFKMNSFFIRAPDGVLIEIVEADPLPEASWLRHIHPKDEHSHPKD